MFMRLGVISRVKERRRGIEKGKCPIPYMGC